MRAVPGADGSGGRDGADNPPPPPPYGCPYPCPYCTLKGGGLGADTGGWVFLQLVEQAIGREVPGKVRAPAPARG